MFEKPSGAERPKDLFIYSDDAPVRRVILNPSYANTEWDNPKTREQLVGAIGIEAGTNRPYGNIRPRDCPSCGRLPWECKCRDADRRHAQELSALRADLKRLIEAVGQGDSRKAELRNAREASARYGEALCAAREELSKLLDRERQRTAAIARQTQWAVNRLADAQAAGDTAADECWHGYIQALRWAMHGDHPEITEPVEHMVEALYARPASEWHDDRGHGVLWWKFPVVEPPYVGSPLCDDWPGDGVYTHWTPILIPREAPAE